MAKSSWYQEKARKVSKFDSAAARDMQARDTFNDVKELRMEWPVSGRVTPFEEWQNMRVESRRDVRNRINMQARRDALAVKIAQLRAEGFMP